MILYQIQCMNTLMWYQPGLCGGTWISSREEAAILVCKDSCNQAITNIERWNIVGNEQDNVIRRPEIKEIDPFEAVSVLRALYDVIDLKALIFHLPNDKHAAWRKAYTRVEKLIWPPT